MSGQMSDVIVVADSEYAIVEPAVGALFDARAAGVMPVSMHTANTRGELARYRFDEGRLVLSDLQVGSIDPPPPINGVEPTTDEYGQVWTYLGLDVPIEWTGDLIVGAEPILDLYVHSGFLPVWHYNTVRAFDIENGVVAAEEDRSDQVAEFRDERLGAEPDEDEGIFERFLDAIKLRLSGSDESDVAQADDAQDQSADADDGEHGHDGGVGGDLT